VVPDSPATDPPDDDPLRDQLLDAAARVFAAKGYDGTKVQDIVREAGLSVGAVYGRFQSKNELLTAAVVRSTVRGAGGPVDGRQVAEAVVRSAERHGPLTDAEALQLEAFVTARRDHEVAQAMREAQRRRRDEAKPLVTAAREEHAVAADLDPDGVLYFVEALRLGLLLLRGAGIDPPHPDSWRDLVSRLIDSLGQTRPDRSPRRRT
jgi:AcrR family transcriptional regulator